MDRNPINQLQDGVPLQAGRVIQMGGLLDLPLPWQAPPFYPFYGGLMRGMFPLGARNRTHSLTMATFSSLLIPFKGAPQKVKQISDYTLEAEDPKQ